MDARGLERVGVGVGVGVSVMAGGGGSSGGGKGTLTEVDGAQLKGILGGNAALRSMLGVI